MQKLIDGVNSQHVIYSVVTHAYTLLLIKMQGKKVSMTSHFITEKEYSPEGILTRQFTPQ